MTNGRVIYVAAFARAIADNTEHATDEQLSAAYNRLLHVANPNDERRRARLITEINRRRDLKEAKGWDPRMK